MYEMTAQKGPSVIASVTSDLCSFVTFNESARTIINSLIMPVPEKRHRHIFSIILQVYFKIAPGVLVFSFHRTWMA